MKFYPHDPDAFLAGTAELNFEQRGAYITLIDLLYSRDGMVPNDDRAVARLLQVDPRLWCRLKTELMAADKIRITTDGLLTANGVDSTRLLVQVRSKLARHRANVRWENYRKAKQNNDPSMPACNTVKGKGKDYSSTSLEAEGEPAAVEKQVAEQGNQGKVEADKQPSKSIIPVTDELKANVKRRWSL